MVSYVAISLLVVFTVTSSCYGYTYRSRGRVVSIPMCPHDDCFISYWCDNVICPENAMKACASQYTCLGQRLVYAMSKAWVFYPPRGVKPFWHCNCRCCNQCSTPSRRGLGFLSSLLGKKK